MYGAQAALPVMKEQGCGVIVNVASLYSQMTSPYVSAYATSKFGVLGFSQVLRQELKSQRSVRVCTVLPGSMDTPIFSHAANYTGRHIKRVPPVSSPERAARAVVRSATHPRRRRTVGHLQQAASWAQAMFAQLYTALVPHVMRLIAIGKEPQMKRKTDRSGGRAATPWRGASQGAARDLKRNDAGQPDVVDAYWTFMGAEVR